MRPSMYGGEMTFTEWIYDGGNYIIFLCGIIAAVWGLCSKGYNLYKSSKRPVEELSSKISNVEKRIDHVYECLGRDNERIDENDKSLRLILRSQMQIIEVLMIIGGEDAADKLVEMNSTIRDHLLSI